jgi:hypothetical protein
MKRLLAALVLVAALAVLVKVLGKPPRAEVDASTLASKDAEVVSVGADTQAAAELALRAKYPDEAELLDRVLPRYRQTALAVEASDGLRGLRLLEKLDLEAIYLFERHPAEFRRLASSLGDDAAAEVLVHWREYFGLKRADDIDRARLIDEVARLSPSKQRIAARYPQALPLLLAEPEGVAALIRRLEAEPKDLADALAVLDLVSLEHGPDDLRRALRTLEHHRALALDAVRVQGPEGFALVALYGPVLEALGSDALPLDAALIVLRVNSDYADTFLRTRTPEALAGHLRHVGALGLVEAVGGSPHGLRLAVEFGDEGDRALEQAGGDAADVVYEDFDDSFLRRRAVEALGRFGPMAAAMLAKYATDADFQVILRRDGAAVIPPLARADVAPEVLLMLQRKPRKGWTEGLAEQVLALSGESGQATIRLIKHDGLARAAELENTDVAFYQFLPLYDLLHMGGVLARGHAPTGGEMAWAALDGAFVVWDVLTLSAAQPGAAAAGEAARGEVKATARQVARSAGRELVEQAAQGAMTTGGRLARWWAVRQAGGTFRLLRRLPEALDKMSLHQVSKMAAPLCRKAGLRLSTWAPRRLVRDGRMVLLSIPPGRWVKYVGINVAQAGVGVVAMHKMEEYLGSRRAPRSD